MTIFGLLRIKNEARWITDVLRSIQPICEHIFVLDDHSTDDTAELCEKEENTTVIRSPFSNLDERRDKDFLLEQAYQCIPNGFRHGDERSPYWALAIDGDEILDERGWETIQQVLATTGALAFRMPIKYLWDNPLGAPGNVLSKERIVRVDGVYKSFRRPSLFRLFNQSMRFISTPWGNGANLHCSSIPQQLLHYANHEMSAPLWHLGYNDRADRIRKHAWYNSIDPNNAGEDCYRHCIQGDVPEVPVHARLVHAGPLELVKVSV